MAAESQAGRRPSKAPAANIAWLCAMAAGLLLSGLLAACFVVSPVPGPPAESDDDVGGLDADLGDDRDADADLINGCQGGPACVEPTPLCGPSACQSGDEGDPCEDPEHCLPGYFCTRAVCYDGGVGDPCNNGNFCQTELYCVSFEIGCQTGREGAPCRSDQHCKDSLECGGDDLCE